MHIKHDIADKNDGVVLVMVLIVLLATIIMGIMLSRTSFFESKIAGNERVYKNNFYRTEGGADYIITDFDHIMSSMTSELALSHTTNLTSRLSSVTTLSGVDVQITLERTGNPPVNSGTSVANTYANYYHIVAQNQGQNVDVGVWRAFPKTN